MKAKMLSDKNTLVTEPKRRPLDKDKARWSDDQKTEVVKAYIILGSLELAAAAARIPFETCRNWKTTGWWAALVDEYRETEKLVLSTRLKGIVEKSLTIVEDRLENGDFIWDQKAQTLIRKPVLMKDAAKVGVDFMGHQYKLVSTEQRQMEEEGVKEKLEKLARSFEEFANKQQKKADVNVTDVVFVKETDSAIYEEERGEGL